MVTGLGRICGKVLHSCLIQTCTNNCQSPHIKWSCGTFS